MNDLRSSVQKPFLRRPPCLKGGDFEEPRLQVCLRRDWPNLWKAEVLEFGISLRNGSNGLIRSLCFCVDLERVFKRSKNNKHSL